MSTKENLSSLPESLQPLVPSSGFTGPIIWWNHHLGFGGVERQICATAQALSEKLDGKADLQLLCEHLDSEDSTAGLEQATPFFANVSDIFSNAPLYRENSAKALRAAEQNFSGLHPVRQQLIAMYAAYFALTKPRLLQVWNADYIHVALAAVLAGVPNILMRCASKSPGFRHPKGIESVNDKLAHQAFCYLCRFPSFFMTANSKEGLEDYRNWLGLPPGSIEYTPNAFVPEQWQQGKDGESLRASLGIPPQAPVIGGIFRFSFTKNPQLWVQTAFNILEANRECYAILAGDGELHAEIQDMVRNSPYASRLLMPGMLADTAAFYDACDVLLHTSRCEGQCNVVLEAQFHRLPVICTDCGGPSEIITDKKTGFIVREHDPNILAAHVLYALNNPEWSAAAGEHGRASVTRTFSPRRSALTYFRIYSERGCV
ncbi:glycosyltransferase [Desulfovibrio sp. OttesenSCG-928-C06]|nr:glycosyltransferase [Desulfovibrio sp. OttesenSCG-928-C06]